MAHDRDMAPSAGREEALYPGLSIRRRLRENLRAMTPGMRVWLIVADFNGLREINSIFGKTVVNVVLGAAHQAVLAILEDFEMKSGCGRISHAFVGDEMIILFPPSALTDAMMERLTQDLKRSIIAGTEKRFIVGALVNLHHHLHKVPPVKFYEYIDRLKNDSIHLDLSRRKRGHLFIAALRHYKETARGALKRVTGLVHRVFQIPADARLRGSLKWLYNSEDRDFEGLNVGFAPSLEASYAAVSNDEVGETMSDAEMDSDSLADSMFEACQERVRKGKPAAGGFAARGLPGLDPACRQVSVKDHDVRGPRIQLLTEGALSYIVHHLSRSGGEGVLMQVEPFYRISDLSMKLSIETLPANHPLLRGNERGMGLKGINEICGYETGDRVVCLLEDLVFAALHELGHSHGITIDNLHLSRFIDCFRIYIHNASVKRDEITAMMKKIAEGFNEHAEGLSLSHLKATIVHNRERIDGSTLLHRLEMTAIAERKPVIAYDDGLLVVRHYSPGVEREGEAIIEEAAFRSAKALGRLRD
jgi:GGDEF domain-containing protein